MTLTSAIRHNLFVVARVIHPEEDDVGSNQTDVATEVLLCIQNTKTSGTGA